MAIIQSYPITRNIRALDLLLGVTDISTNGTPEYKTTSFLMSDVIGGGGSGVIIGTANGLSLEGSVLSLGLSSASANGALSSTDWSRFNSKQAGLNGTGFVKIVGTTISYDNNTYVPSARTININGNSQDLSADRIFNVGTVTSVAALTLGTTGSDIGSTVVNNTTNPVITLNIPTASASSRGALSNTDWLVFNSKQPPLNGLGIVKSTNGTISYLTDNSANWNIAYNNSIVSADVSGTQTKTLTLNQQDGGQVTASWTDDGNELVFSSPLIDTAGVVSIPLATSIANGYLSNTDWTAFNSKQPALNGTGFIKISGTTISYDNNTYTPTATTITTTAPLQGGGNLSANRTLSITQATTSASGYLSNTDWNTFNSKQPAGNYITALTGEATASGPGSAAVTLSNSAVLGKVLSGLSVSGSTIEAADNMLTAFGKLQNQINGIVSGSLYKGSWNAATNTPTLVSSVGTQGDYYVVSVAGNTSLNGVTDWQLGDWAIFNGSVWQKIDNTDSVISVNGEFGIVALTTENIPEDTNLYYTNARVSANTDVAANTLARHAALTLGSSTNGLSLAAGQILSLGLSSTSAAGALSSTDWNTFNNKQGALTFTGPLLNTSGTVSIPLATGTVSGYLSSDNWTTFNNKQAALTFGAPLANNSNVVSMPVASGTINGYLSSTNWNTFNNKQNALTFSAPLANNSDTISMSVASGSANGYLSATNWNTFNSKQDALNGNGLLKFAGTSPSYITDNSVNWDNAYNNSVTSVSVTSGSNTKTLTLSQQDGGTLTTSWSDLTIAAPANGLSISSNALSLQAAGASSTGALTSTDWNTFNNKVPASRSITINGTTQNLSENRSWTISAATSIVGNYRIATGANNIIYSPTLQWEPIPEMTITYIPRGSAVNVSFSMPVVVVAQNQTTYYRIVIVNGYGEFTRPWESYDIYTNTQMITVQDLLISGDDSGIRFNETNTIRIDWYGSNNLTRHDPTNGRRMLILTPFE